MSIMPDVLAVMSRFISQTPMVRQIRASGFDSASLPCFVCVLCVVCCVCVFFLFSFCVLSLCVS